MAKIKILIVGNDPVMLGLLQQNLGNKDYQLINTQQFGWDLKAELDKENPDLVVVDIMMPDLDGIEICLRIRQWSQVPIMMLSAWGAGIGKVRGLNLGADNYLTEPFGMDELEARIKDTMQRNLLAMGLLSDIKPNLKSKVS